MPKNEPRGTSRFTSATAIFCPNALAKPLLVSACHAAAGSVIVTLVRLGDRSRAERRRSVEVLGRHVEVFLVSLRPFAPLAEVELGVGPRVVMATVLLGRVVGEERGGMRCSDSSESSRPSFS